MMSADNWTICPMCLVKQAKKKQAMLENARKSYGKVKPEEYERLTREATTEPEEPDTTLREDYGIGMHRKRKPNDPRQRPQY